MKFKKYNSLENSYRTKFMDKITEQGHASGEWVVQEKIHGANFSLWCDGENIQGAKRSGFVGGEGADFFNSHIIRERYWNNIMEIFNALKKASPSISAITIYGELFGGNYPHKDVERGKFKGVQSGVYYSPDIEFYAFDLVIWEGEEQTYADVDQANRFFEKKGLLHAQTLLRGTLAECLEYSNEFRSTIPALLGYPELEEDNSCEGVVIRPVKPAFLWDGSRVIIKNKNAKWSEREKTKKPRVKEIVNLTPEAEKMLDEMLTYVTENRLRNVLSKFGTVTDKDFGNLMGQMNQDTVEDFLKDFDEEFNALEKKERKYITKKVGSENANLLRSNFLNVVDGVF